MQTFLLPKPSDIAQSFWDDKGALWHAGCYTLKEAVGGFVIGGSLGILVALLLARFRTIGAALMPYAIAANAIPIIAFAPITNNWFGLLNPHLEDGHRRRPLLLPDVINTLRGLISVSPASIELDALLRGR